MGFGNLFDDQAVEPSSPLYWALAVVFLLLLVGSLYLWLRGQRLYAEDRFHRRLAERYAGLFAVFSAIGFMAALFSLLAVPFLSKRIWLVLALLGFVATAAHLAYYVRRRYRRDLDAHLVRERRQRSMPRPKSGGRRRKAKRR